MIVYILKSTVLLGLLWGLYKLLLENEKMHHFKRFYLLAALILGLATPLMQIDIQPNTKIAGINLDKLDQVVEAPSKFIANSIEPMLIPAAPPIESNANQVAPAIEQKYTLGKIIFVAYISIAIILLLRFGFGLFQLGSAIRRGTFKNIEGNRIILLEESITPQSFLKWIFLNRTDFETGNIGQEIIEHERAHIQQLHSLDVLFIEFLKVVFWFNPFMYAFKHAMLLNHEFLADEHVISKVLPAQQYQNRLLDFALNSTQTSLSNKLNK